MRGVGVVVVSEVEELVVSGIWVFRPDSGPGEDSPDFLEPEENVRAKMFFGMKLLPFPCPFSETGLRAEGEPTEDDPSSLARPFPPTPFDP